MLQSLLLFTTVFLFSLCDDLTGEVVAQDATAAVVSELDRLRASVEEIVLQRAVESGVARVTVNDEGHRCDFPMLFDSFWHAFGPVVTRRWSNVAFTQALYFGYHRGAWWHVDGSNAAQETGQFERGGGTDEERRSEFRAQSALDAGIYHAPGLLIVLFSP